MRYFCCDDDARRDAVLDRPGLNGIDFVEVVDEAGQPDEDRQRTLFVHFLHDPTPLGITVADVAVEGGDRITSIRILDASVRVEPTSGSSRPILVVVADRAGDFSTYTLRLAPSTSGALPGLDPVMAAVDFSFKVDCNVFFDPLSHADCPVEPHDEPTIDYLARDYLSFRQLLLDRLALLAPDWTERNAADEGIALVELLAYVGDQLSYRQDAIATEAYLSTCRLRVSARRHARLVDYAMHDGCNARTWVHVRLASGATVDLSAARFYSRLPDLKQDRIVPGSADQIRADTTAATIFELLPERRDGSVLPYSLRAEHNELRFHTWGARDCCLPAGAVRATLKGDLPHLRPGMVLVIQEMLGPRTGDAADADPRHRHPVRLTEVWPGVDPIGALLDDGDGDPALPVTEIRWADADALPFPICVSAETDETGRFVSDVSVAFGNIVLADHGLTLEQYDGTFASDLGVELAEDLGVVPEATLAEVLLPDRDPVTEEARCRPDGTRPIPPRFRPALRRRPVTQAVPYDVADTSSAAAAMQLDPARARPMVELLSWRSARARADQERPEPPLRWETRIDLVESAPDDRVFAVEVESDGGACLRFGGGASDDAGITSDAHGLRPASGTAFSALYRVGNGVVGNIGAQTLAHVLSADAGVESVTNPLPARGGVDMETIEEVRQRAPFAFQPQDLPGRPGSPDGRTLARAVTTADYAAITDTLPDVQRTAATMRWTGSWRTVSVAVDRLAGVAVDDTFSARIRDALERFRLAGHDLEIDPPRPVSLEIAMMVCVRPGYVARDVRAALAATFSDRRLPDGRLGVFHPDNLTFGQTVYLSPLYAAAQAVDGVESVRITTFERRDRPGPEAVALGRLSLGRLEIAQLANDPNRPERGVFHLTVEGGA